MMKSWSLLVAVMAFFAPLTAAWGAGAHIPEEVAVRALIGEAIGKSDAELYAHACALRNRGTVSGVFGYVDVKRRRPEDLNETNWQRASRAWCTAEYSGDVTWGATHWLSDYDIKHCRKVWKHWIGGYEKTVKIGETTFFRRKA